MTEGFCAIIASARDCAMMNLRAATFCLAASWVDGKCLLVGDFGSKYEEMLLWWEPLDPSREKSILCGASLAKNIFEGGLQTCVSLKKQGSTHYWKGVGVRFGGYKLL